MPLRTSLRHNVFSPLSKGVFYATMYPMAENTYLKDIILKMRDVDQSARIAAKDSRGNKPPNMLVYAIDMAHNANLHRIIDQYGYPNEEMVGAEGLQSWWLLVQHQDFDIQLQEKCLAECNFAPEEYAHLVDRVALNKGEEQTYGTQYSSSIENKEEINKNRTNLGLDPLK